VLIGLFPAFFISLLNKPVGLFTGRDAVSLNVVAGNAVSLMQVLSQASWLLILLTVSIFVIRRFVMRQHPVAKGSTWGCGFVAPVAKAQYTAGSFVRTYSKLFAPFLLIGKHEEEIKGIFPSEAKYHTHPYDEIEKWLIDNPLKANKSFMGRFLFLHNGKLQFYILYGVLFILAVLSIPLLYQSIQSLMVFLKNL
jgi:hypothetical protein